MHDVATIGCPDFLVIGASKTGTTSLHEYLSQHPEIYMSREKEPGFFLFNGKSNVDRRLRDRPFVNSPVEYRRLFGGARSGQQRGESTTYYLDLATPDVVSRIRQSLPGVRLIATIRHPVDHAYSRYVSLRRDGQIADVGFAELMQHDLCCFDELDYAASGYRFIAKSYALRLKLFADAFSGEQLMVSLYDDYRRSPSEFFQKTFDYLDVDRSFSPDISVRHNEAWLYRSRSIAYIFNRPNPIRFVARHALPEGMRRAGERWVQRRGQQPAPRLDPDLRAMFTRRLTPEIDALEDLLDRDLTHWRA